MTFFDETQVNVQELAVELRQSPVIILREQNPTMIVLPINASEIDDWTPEQYEYLKLFAKHFFYEQTDEIEVTPQIDPGFIEVSLAMAGIAIAIAVFLPEAENLPQIIKLGVAIFASIIASISSFSGLWLLSLYRFPEQLSNVRVIKTLLWNKDEGPYWFKAIGLFFLFILSIVIGVFAVTIRVGGSS